VTGLYEYLIALPFNDSSNIGAFIDAALCKLKHLQQTDSKWQNVDKMLQSSLRLACARDDVAFLERVATRQGIIISQTAWKQAQQISGPKCFDWIQNLASFDMPNFWYGEE